MHLQEETEGSKEVQGLHFPHLALAFPVACYRLVTNFQETNRQQETHARSVNLRLSRNLSPFLVTSRRVGYSFTFFSSRAHGALSLGNLFVMYIEGLSCV